MNIKIPKKRADQILDEEVEKFLKENKHISREELLSHISKKTGEKKWK